jgi:hypothetical protein
MTGRRASSTRKGEADSGDALFYRQGPTSLQDVHKQQITLLFGRKSLLRGTSRAGSLHDQNELASIHSALQDLRMSHPHDTPPHPPPPPPTAGPPLPPPHYVYIRQIQPAAHS